jgi:Cu/Ag efflux protein CusF
MVSSLVLGPRLTGRGIRGALVVLSVLLLAACGVAQEESGDTAAEPQAFAFVGTVERVDTQARIVAVRNEDIPGWMMAMTMNFVLDQPDLVDSLEVGDRITATVYEGNFTTLFQVEVVEP